jgi:glycosyltransferase involved in cell wall biosynthesis
MLRLLLIAPSPDIVGGQSVQASRLMEELAKEPEIDLRFLAIDVPQLRFIRQLKYIRTLANFIAFNLLIMADVVRADVVHIFTAAYSSYFLWTVPTILFSRLTGRKVLVNCHDGQAGDHLQRSPMAIRTLRMAHAVVAPSGFLVDVFKRFGIRAEAIFNIIETGRFRYRRRAPLRPVFMTNRGLEPLYNVGCVIRAFAIVQGRYPEATLTIAHDGPCRGELEQLAKELKLERVSFVGKVPQSEIAGLYDNADIYLTSPNIDNMPLSLLECFASGLPLVATQAGGIPYIVTDGETGLLVPCGDHAAMAARAVELLEDPQLAERLAENGRRECGKYSGDATRGQWVALYRRLNGSVNADRTRRERG